MKILFDWRIPSTIGGMFDTLTQVLEYHGYPNINYTFHGEMASASRASGFPIKYTLDLTEEDFIILKLKDPRFIKILEL